MTFMTLKINFYILQLQHKELKNNNNNNNNKKQTKLLKWYIRFFYIFNFWGMEGIA